METLGSVARRYKALGHPARLRILAVLRGGELCVCQINSILPVAPSTLSAHLKELRRAGLLEERKEGRWVYYGLARSRQLKRFFGLLWTDMEADQQIQADAALLSALRTVTVEELCRANLDLVQLGIVGPKRARNENRK